MALATTDTKPFWTFPNNANNPGKDAKMWKNPDWDIAVDWMWLDEIIADYTYKCRHLPCKYQL